MPHSQNRRRSRFAMWLIILSLLGFGLRLTYVISQQHLVVKGDGFHYFLSATLAAHGQWFEFPLGAGGPDAHHPPLWTVILSLVAVMGGTTQLAQQVCAVLIGSSAIALVGLAGRKIAGERVGLIAAALAAIYPGLWQYERELLSEVVLLPLVALVLLLAYRYHEHPSLIRAVLLSGVCALLSLARAEQLGLFVLLIVPLVLATRTINWKRRFGWLGATAVTALVIFAPWVGFNAARFQEPVLLSTGLGSTMNAGACDTTFAGDLLGHFDAPHCNYPHLYEISPERSKADLQLRSIALRYTRDHLSQLPRVLLAREARTFSLYRPLQEVRLASEWDASPTWVGYAWTAMYWLLAPFAVAGAVLLRRRRVLLYPLFVEFVIVVVAAGTTFGLIRYRAAAEVPILILSSVALERIWRWWRDGSSASKTQLGPHHLDALQADG